MARILRSSRGVTSSSGSVVVAEDEPSQRRLLAEALVLRGFAVVAVEDGDALYDLLVARTGVGGELTAVIADLRMPGASVERSARWMKRHRRGVPFIVVTAENRVRDAWLTDAEVPILAKPIRMRRLVRLLGGAPR